MPESGGPWHGRPNYRRGPAGAATGASAGLPGPGPSSMMPAVRVVVVGAYARSLVMFRGPLLAALVGRGHDVIAIAPDGDDATRATLEAMGVRLAWVPMQRAGLDPRADARTVAALVRTFRALRPDAVLTYTIKPVVWGGIAARIARVPRRFAMITGFGYAFQGQERLRRRALAAAVRGLYRAGLAGSDVVFFQNPDDRREFDEMQLVPASARVEVVRGSGVDVDHYAVAPLPAGPPSFLYVGRLVTEKGILDYVAAAKRVKAEHPAARFRVVGGIDPNPASVSTAAIEAWVRDGVIEWAGELADVRPEIAQASVLVLPSYREGTPRSVLEAMSMGRAVITTDVPGCRETIVDGVEGRLVPARDPEALATACRAMFTDAAVTERMGAAGRRRVEALYDARVVAARMVDVMALHDA
jgi:glycosyltransferase involved in cell wall biosynthesis